LSKYSTRVSSEGAGSRIHILNPVGEDIATTHDPIIAETIAGLLNAPHVRRIKTLEAQKQELEWRSLRMTIALRLIRHYGLSGVSLPGSGSVMHWMREWIDAGFDTPLMWPGNVPSVCVLLTQWGFANVAGVVGLKLSGDAPSESVN